MCVYIYTWSQPSCSESAVEKNRKPFFLFLHIKLSIYSITLSTSKYYLTFILFLKLDFFDNKNVQDVFITLRGITHNRMIRLSKINNNFNYT